MLHYVDRIGQLEFIALYIFQHLLVVRFIKCYTQRKLWAKRRSKTKTKKMSKNLSSVVSMWIWSIDVSGAEAADASTPAKSIVVIDSIVVIILCAFIYWIDVRKFVLLHFSRTFATFCFSFWFIFDYFIILLLVLVGTPCYVCNQNLFEYRQNAVNLRQRQTFVHTK